MRRVSVFGATGSIGQNTLDLIKRAPDAYQVVALSGAGNITQLAQDAQDLNAEIAITARDDLYDDLKSALAGTGIEVAAGQVALNDAACRPADWVMSAIIGAAGLQPGLLALQNGADLALANKESMVTAGRLMRETAQNAGRKILPVDSEHSAVFQALLGEDLSAVERVIITASGGAFLGWPIEKLADVTPQQAATHPNWDMGTRITIDSASMFNKALEVIEAKEFFDFRPSQIEVLIHPQSMIHALVGFTDGALMAHIGPPDMRHAIGFALHYPNRAPLPVERLDLRKIGQFTFQDPDEVRHPALRLARTVMETGGLSGAVFNAAKEIALDGFLDRQIGFLDMAVVVETVMDRLLGRADINAAQTLDNVLAMDHLARQEAWSVIARKPI